MRLPDPRPRRAEAPNGLAAAARASGRFPALPENADRELPRPPREVAFLIREPERRSGALTVRISSLEALRLVRPEVRVATDDVIAVDEPAHQRVTAEPSCREGGGVTSRERGNNSFLLSVFSVFLAWPPP